MSGRHALLVGINSYPWVAGANLRGCLNDVELMAAVLTERFRFPPQNLLVLRDTEATRDALVAAMDELYRRLGDGDVAVVFYAGHGSRVRDPESPDGFRESIVPHDSGRGEHPNRDVTDLEIDRFVKRLNEKTPYVTLIFDCCHSGQVTRGANSEVREVEPDPRWSEAEVAPPSPARGLAPREWLPGHRQAVVVAACRADEWAYEHRVFENGRVLRHGALTFFLGRRLLALETAVTWRQLHSTLAPALTAVHRRQHPQLEGRVDIVVFADEDEDAAWRRRLLELQNPASRLHGRVGLDILRFDPAQGRFVAAADAVFSAGERAEIVIENRHDEALWVSLLEVGVDGRVELLLPRSGHPTYHQGGRCLAPGERLRLAADYYAQDPDLRDSVQGGLTLELPQGFTWTGAAVLYLKLWAAPCEADFELFMGHRAVPPAPATDWTTLTLAVEIRPPGA